nr:MAG TPA: hypothetical protein [Caudoviricetes sp.]
MSAPYCQNICNPCIIIASSLHLISSLKFVLFICISDLNC